MRGRIYFVGIGGIGMSGLARYFKAHDYDVSGSDSAHSTITDSLAKDSIKVRIGHRSGNIKAQAAARLDFIVYNRAISKENPELIAAAKYGIPVIPYAKVLGKLTERLLTIAISGSHGKSTTTSLAGLSLTAAGLDPNILVGTNLKELGEKNVRIGRGPYLVLEADDFGAAFLDYSPFISIITNVDREHLDFYKTFGGVKTGFLKFIERTRKCGALIVNRDDKILFGMRARIAAIAKKKRLRVIWYSIYEHRPSSRSRSLHNRNRKHPTPTLSPAAHELKTVMKIPGEHNLSNAMAVYELGKLLNISKKKLVLSLGSYNGAWRRMEYRGDAEFGGKVGAMKTVAIYDDYAHHPTEIMATLKAFKENSRSSNSNGASKDIRSACPLICVFQPHQTKRLQALFKEFVSAFTSADALVLIPSYKVAGRDETNSKFTSESLAGAIAKKYPKEKIYYLAEPKHLKHVLKTIIELPTFAEAKFVTIVMMGAGDIVNYTDSLI